MLSFGNEGGAVQFFLFLDKLTGVSGNDCWEFGNKNRNSKGMEKIIPKLREWEGNEKIYSQNSGKGRE